MKRSNMPVLLVGVLLVAGVGCSDDGVLGPSCTQLQQMCPRDTQSLLTQTCENAVATKDESSCHDGLSDKDIKSNCVNKSAADSGTTTTKHAAGTKADPGSGSCGCAACETAVKAACKVCPKDEDCTPVSDQCVTAASLTKQFGCTACAAGAQGMVCH